MDIRIPHSWLLEYISTKIKPRDIASRISLSGPSIDRVQHVNGDTIYEAEITTNRPDSFSVYGFAREAAAILHLPFKEYFSDTTLKLFKKKCEHSSKKYQKEFPEKKYKISIDIQEPTLCHRYCSVVIEGVRVAPSPEWMQKRLILLGMRPINNIVDATNYVMLEYGQPLHAFDADRISGEKNQKKINIRKARDGEVLETLDGEKKILKKNSIVIADSKKVLALAGIKGGKDAGISQQTKTLILEAAYFDPISIRKTSRELGLRTDASVRFEKGLSSEYPLFALSRLTELLLEYAGGTVTTPVYDAYPVREKEKSIVLSPTTYKRIVGMPLSHIQAVQSLKTLGFQKSSQTQNGIIFNIPFWRRMDIEGEADVVEEVARMNGYTHLPHEPLRGPIPRYPRDPALFWESRTKHVLRDLGWTECMTYSLISEKSIEQVGLDPQTCIKVINPLSRDFEYLRPCLLPALLEVLVENEQRRESLRLFELGTVYHESQKKNNLPDEKSMLTCVLSEKNVRSHKYYLLLKGLVERLYSEWFSSSRSDIVVKRLTTHSLYDPHFSAEVFLGATSLGYIGVPRKDILKKYGLKQSFGLCEIRLSECVNAMNMQKNFISLPKYPTSVRDIACVIEKKLTYETIQKSLCSVDSLISHVELFDIFEHDTLGKSRKSFAFHITYQSEDRTLLTEEVDKIHERVRTMLQEKFHAEIR